MVALSASGTSTAQYGTSTSRSNLGSSRRWPPSPAAKATMTTDALPQPGVPWPIRVPLWAVAGAVVGPFPGFLLGAFVGWVSFGGKPGAPGVGDAGIIGAAAGALFGVVTGGIVGAGRGRTGPAIGVILSGIG